MTAADDAVLAASELVANAVQAAPGSTVTLCIARQPGCVRVTVLDSSPDPAAAGRPRPDTLAEGGRGLMVVATLSRRWGSYRVPGGKAVYAEIGIGWP
jgi:anti-sigma regulatory factor (Ser/Thr protein kinase)